MTAQYWTITGFDMWRLDERNVFDFKNLNTGEVVTCTCVTEAKEHKFLPVTMPKVKGTKVKKQKVKKATKKPKAEKSLRRGPRALSKYKGVSPDKTPGKFRVQYWDSKKKRNIYLGTFDGELLAAAAYEEHIGNHKEARRLRNEYQEGNCQPETEDVPTNPGQFPSEE